MYTMSDMSPGQLQAMDDMNRSDASSSSFNLSTDAEDSEYETLRRRGVMPIARPRKNGDNSVLSAISAPAPYSGNAEEERLYPSMHGATDEILTPTHEPVTPEKLVAPIPVRQPARTSSLVRKFAPMSPEEDYAHSSNQPLVSPKEIVQSSADNRSNVYSMNETEDDLRAWGVDPSTVIMDPTSARSGLSQGSPRFNFETDGGGDGFTPRSNTSAPVDPPASTTSQRTGSRNFTSPKSRLSESSGFSSDVEDFMDFGAFGNNAFAPQQSDGPSNGKSSPAAGWRDEKKMQEPPERNAANGDANEIEEVIDAPPKEPEIPIATLSCQYAHSSPGGTDTALSELLAQAKDKQKRGSRVRSSRASSSSVNSAPAITASFLRQHHGLGKYSSAESNDRTSNDEGGVASVSDIIQSLEASNQTRSKDGSRASYGHRSVGDAGAASTARAVKERLREKRRMERETGGPRAPGDSSSDNSENEASESWLFDEVTGALGPRGIAADLESLSGRSNRSRESKGNKSHLSRSRRPRQSGHRRGKSSGDSVDSRASRASRYSHRSTKSFLSQMSEQSRSVANDLLRLEMQLAMVGNSDKMEEQPVGRSSMGSASVPGAASWSNRSSSGGVMPRKSLGATSRSPTYNSDIETTPAISHATRRNKITVVAPPGKLGIILANKADSKGTVVSGVRTSSVLVDKISPGDRIVAIDGEDVSRMTVSEITTIMSRKADYDRTLTVLTVPKHVEQYTGIESPSNVARSTPPSWSSQSGSSYPSNAQTFGRH